MMTRNLIIDNDMYFCINLKSLKGLISIHETKKLSPDEYHSINSVDTNDYQILAEVEKKVGQKICSWNLFPESYQTYEFQNATYQIINDFNIDGFEYDSKRKVLVYGWIYGIYAISDGNNYYDVITGEKIPNEIIANVRKIETVDAYSDMIDDLRLIEKNKNAYIKITKERISKLSQGENNRKLAQERYKQNYETTIEAQREKRIERAQQQYEKSRIESSSKRKEVKKILRRIKNNN